MKGKETIRRREPITDTQLLLTITICIFVCMYVAAMLIWGGGFKKPQMLFDILNDNAYLIIIACGLTIVMITGSIDISVGGVTALVAMVGVMLLNGNLGLFSGLIEALGLSDGWRIVFALLMSLLIGLAFGIVQGYLIAHLEIQPFIITLAGMFFARGMITIISVDPQKAPQSLMDILQTRIEMPWLGSPNKKGVIIPARMEIGVVVALVIVVLVFLLLRKSRLGRNFYAVGGNRQSALMLGVNVRRTRFMAHLFSGLLSGIAGFVFMMHTGAGNATNATAAEMNAIASSIIGGTLLTGGVGNVLGTFFGVLTLSTIKSIVMTSGLRDPWWQSITTGAMLGFFIVLQSVVLSARSKSRAKRLIREKAKPQAPEDPPPSA
ncbi:MAG: sugar ABC transporter permease YjfF [Oscillospiraceae bacterium]|nr:sugar ABC transporter permease YjfF [Oscillospiraceae bacterium]